MENVLIILLSVVTIGLFLVLYLVFDLKRKASKPHDEGSLKLLLEQVNEVSRTVDSKIGENTKQISESMKTQFSESAKLIRDVTEGLTKLDDTNKQVVSFADQLKNLQDILKNPKQRGVLGEYYLETTLKNVLGPGMYQTQYAFKNGEIVDAIVKVNNKIIPIDSKFSLENYNRLTEASDESEKIRLSKAFINDLKLRITETAKYIRPEEDTTDFAFMFIPHEAIYYDLLTNKIGSIAGNEENLIQRAAGTYKVLIISPTSFLAYLQTVMQGLNAMHIEKEAEQIKINVIKLQKHLQSYETYHTKLGSSLDTVVNHYNNTSKEFKKVDKDMIKITDKSLVSDFIQVEKSNKELL